MPATVSGPFASAGPPASARRRRSSAISFAWPRRSSSRARMRSGSSSGRARSSAAASPSAFSAAATWASAPSPVSASTRRTPLEVAASETSLKAPMSPVRRDVGAAAELERVGRRRRRRAPARAGAHRDDADLVAVLLAEERAGAEPRGGVRGHDPGLDGRVLADVGVDLGLDGGELVGRHRLRVGEVEAQPVGGDEAAALGDVVAEGAAQRLVQQVGRRVVGADRAAAVVVDGELGGGAAGEGALLDAADVDEEAGLLADVGDRARGPGRCGACRCRRPGRPTRRRRGSGSGRPGPRRRPRRSRPDGRRRRGRGPGPRRSRCRSRGTRSGRGARRGRTRPPRRRPRRSRPRRRGPWPSARPSPRRSRRCRRRGRARAARPG